jgi:tetratricopeptide (TPR) repeat protein
LDGEIEKALETSKKFPNYYFTANEECENIYDRGTDEWWPWVQKNIQDLTECLTVKIRNCALYGKISPEEKIRIFKKAITLFETIYDEGDYNFYNYNLAELNIWIADRYIEMAEYNTAWEYLDKGLSFAKAYDELPQKVKHTSFLVNRLTQDMMNICSGFEGNDVARELKYLIESSFYNNVRNIEGYKNIIEKYKPYAKNDK